MRKYKPKQLLLILAFTLTLVILLFPLNAKGISDLTFTFDQDILYSETEPDFFINKLSNVKNSSFFTGHYNATYSFENDIDGTEPEGVLVNKAPDCYALINSSLGSHDKILNISDNNNAGFVNIAIPVSQARNTTIEFWFTKSSVESDTRIEISFIENDTAISHFRFVNDDSQYYNGSTYLTLHSNFLIANIFSHFRFDLDDNSNTFDFYLNGILSRSNISYWNPSILGVDKFRLNTRLSTINYSAYLDGIGFKSGTQFLFESDFDISSETTNGIGITFDGNNYWISDSINDAIYEYGVNGVYTNNFHNISVNTLNAVDLTFNNGFFYILDAPLSIDIYTFSGNYITTFGVDNPFSTLTAITNDGNFLYLLDSFTHAVYRYTFNGINTGFFFNVSSEVIVEIGVVYTNDSFFVVDGTDEDVFQYDLNGIYTGISFVATFNNLAKTATFNGTHISIIDHIAERVRSYRYNLYDIGNNFIPYIQVNESIKEVDRFEFAYSSFEVLYNISSDVFSGWIETDIDDDYVNIAENDVWNADRVVSITHFVPNPNILGLNKTFNQHGNIINVSWSIEFQTFSTNSKYEMKVYSFDNTIISDIYFENGQLRYNNKSGFTTLRSDLHINETYTLNLYINYNDNITILRFSIDGIPTNTFIIPLINGQKEGLGFIETLVIGSVISDMELEIDYIGVYINNTSISTEFGYLIIDDILPLFDTWFFNEHNLVNFNILGNSTVYVSESPYNIIISVIGQIAPNGIYTSTDMANIYDLPSLSEFGNKLVQDPFIWFQFYGQFQFFDLLIEGVKLIEGVNEYSLIQDTKGVDTNNSFFRVIGNQLIFTHTSNDNEFEFIEARFDINDISTDGYTIGFGSTINGQAFGFFRLNLTLTSNIVPFPLGQSSTRFIPTQNKTINDIVILITDRDIDTISGITNGFIFNIKFIVSADITASILITALIVMIIPLLMILVPSVSISQIYGKMLLIPIFILMSIICVATGIIPVWLFFIIGISFSMFIIKSRDMKGIS